MEKKYIKLLKKELKPAFGCTEPIALAYCAAKAKEVLGKEPKKIYARLSGNIIKNAFSVYVPGTEGRKGIPISIVAGAFLGDARKELEVLAGVDKSGIEKCDKLIEDSILEMEHENGVENLYIDLKMVSDNDSSRVIIKDAHTNIVLIEKNGEEILNNMTQDEEDDEKFNLDFDGIYDFAMNGDYSQIKDILDMQINYNMAIAKEGLTNPWGSNIGKIVNGNSAKEKCIAHAAAGSDARMSGCELPVVINSGSGNQGISVSVPVIVYAKEKGIEGDRLYRGLILSNLIGLYIKQGIGKLSAYCGVVSAGSASVCGIAMLEGLDSETIKSTLSNSLATNSGIICDGAKASCASKIASSISGAFLALEQAKSGNSFAPRDGIVKDNIDLTIKTVGTIAMDGMKTTDEVILKEMLKG